MQLLEGRERVRERESERERSVLSGYNQLHKETEPATSAEK